MIHDEEYEKHYSPDGEHIEYLMENPQPTQPQEEWQDEVKILLQNSEITKGTRKALEGLISNLISEIRKEERELIIRIIEEEKEVIFNSEKFYNGGEEVFGLLLKIQEKIKHL